MSQNGCSSRYRVFRINNFQLFHTLMTLMSIRCVFYFISCLRGSGLDFSGFSCFLHTYYVRVGWLCREMKWVKFLQLLIFKRCNGSKQTTWDFFIYFWKNTNSSRTVSHRRNKMVFLRNENPWRISSKYSKNLERKFLLQVNILGTHAITYTYLIWRIR